MPPRTIAERQRAYRERLKKERPEKFEEIRIKHLAKVKESNKKKKDTNPVKEEPQEKRRGKNAKKAGKKGKNVKEKGTEGGERKHDDDAKLQEKPDKIENIAVTEKIENAMNNNSELHQCNETLGNACDLVRKEMDNITKGIARSKLIE